MTDAGKQDAKVATTRDANVVPDTGPATTGTLTPTCDPTDSTYASFYVILASSGDIYDCDIDQCVTDECCYDPGSYPSHANACVPQ